VALLLIGKPWNSPAAAFARPSASSSWLGSTSYPPRTAQVRESRAVSSAGYPDLPEAYRPVGQPVLVPGSMDTASYVLVGEAGNEAFASTCHGAGRTMSRHQALRMVTGKDLQRRRRDRGILVETRGLKALAEETPEAYKDVDEVVRSCEGAGLSRPVARLRPLGVLKG
jgi:tRNA-splicing ligase RtcB